MVIGKLVEDEQINKLKKRANSSNGEAESAATFMKPIDDPKNRV